MTEGKQNGGRGASPGWVVVETIAATGLAVYLSLRFGAPLVWLILPLAIALLHGHSLSDYGLDFRLRPPSAATHLLLGGSLLLLYGAVHAWFAQEVLGQTLAPGFTGDLRYLAPQLAVEFLTIGIPEETFFRGYFQTRWNVAFGRPWKLCGAKIGLGFWAQSIVFALCHLATGDWTRLRVFFFALLAGWLRERSGSVMGPAVYHAVANIWYRLLVAAFR